MAYSGMEASREISASSCVGNNAKAASTLPCRSFLENRMECLIVNGKSPERVIRAVYGKPVPGTMVKGNV